jgi:glycosyltransferase involved in cell wall biosynthesis
LVYIPNYVDARLFRPKFEPGNYALYFGRLAPEKGVATLIRSVAKSGISLKIAGVGPEDAALRQLASELQARVEFLGFQSGDVLHDLIRGSRCVVLPSEWYENAPMSILESMALGKPVLGSRIGGIPELIEEGATGWLFASGSVEELSQRLLEIQGMPPGRIQVMGQLARTLVEARFTRARYAEAIRGLYASHGVQVESTQTQYVGAAA